MTDPSKDWSPAEPLRADATDGQIIARYHAEYEPKKQLYQSFADIARELADAGVAHVCGTCNEELAVWERRYERDMAERDAEITRLRETIQRLNRRVQSAESGLAEKINANAGQSLGRALANASATYWQNVAEDKDAELVRLRGHVAQTLREAIDAARHSSEGTHAAE